MVIIFSIFSYFRGLLLFSLKRKHLLLILLRLEFIIISLYINMFLFISLNFHEYYFCLVFITIRVCEGVLGLSILVSLIRSHGNDYFQRFNILW